jgi:hypothetical protein
MPSDEMEAMLYRPFYNDATLMLTSLIPKPVKVLI